MRAPVGIRARNRVRIRIWIRVRIRIWIRVRIRKQGPDVDEGRGHDQDQGWDHVSVKKRAGLLTAYDSHAAALLEGSQLVNSLQALAA